VRGEPGAEAHLPLTPSHFSRLTSTSHASPLTSHARTVGQALRETRELLQAGGVPDAARESSELYACLKGRPTSAAWLDRDEPCAEELRAALEEAARRRAMGWPQAYAVGRANFRGIWLAVDRRVLIPRPETEGLVDVVLAWMRQRPAGRPRAVVADVGTGSGAVAIALALESDAERIVAIDRSPGALEVARDNAARHGVAGRVELRQGDLVAPLGGERVDVLVSNPPYVATADWERLEPGVRDFEPREALDGGPDGLAPTRELVRAAMGTLKPGGLLALEVDAPRADRGAALAAQAGLAECAMLEDLFGRPRYLRARRPADGCD